MRFDQLLLTLRIDPEIRVRGILVNHRHIARLIGDIHEPAIDLRLLQMRVKHQNKRLHPYSFLKGFR